MSQSFSRGEKTKGINMSEKSIEKHIDQMIMWECLNQLKGQDRQILFLYYWWGYRDAEIGEILSLSQQLVNYKRNKAHKQLRDKIHQSLNE